MEVCPATQWLAAAPVPPDAGGGMHGSAGPLRRPGVAAAQFVINPGQAPGGISEAVAEPASRSRQATGRGSAEILPEYEGGDAGGGHGFPVCVSNCRAGVWGLRYERGVPGAAGELRDLSEPAMEYSKGGLHKTLQERQTRL